VCGSEGPAYLTLHSETDLPDVLAGAVELPPDDQWSKGDLRGRLRRPAPSSAVQYGSGLAEDRSPTDHASALAVRLRPYCDRIHAVTAVAGRWGVVSIVEHAGFATEWFANVEAWVKSDDLQTFAHMGVSLRLDAYVYSSDED
jgi:hypothetical protein